MAELRDSIKKFGISMISNLLNLKPADEPAKPTGATLDDLALDDLRKEKIRIEQEERKMLARLQNIEDHKRQLFEEGVRKASEREQRVLARKIKELDVEGQSLDRMLQAFSKQMRIINGLLQVKERQRILGESGLSSILANIDLADLITYIDRASVDGEFHIDKLDELLRTLEESEAVSPKMTEDQDVLDILQAMQRAQEAADSPDAIENQFEDLSRRMETRRESLEDLDLES